MTSKELKDILDFIKKDPEAQSRANSYLAEILPDSLGIAGGIRNLPLWASEFITDKLGFGDTDFAKNLSDENYKLICGGIAEATAKVIQDEIDKGNPLFKSLKSVAPGHRVIDGWDHTATKFTEKNGSTFVLDFHQTLNIDNPLVFPSYEDWEKGKNGKTYEDYIEQNPVTNPNGEKTNQQPTNPNQNGVDVGPLTSTHSGGPASANVFTRINELLTQINASLQQLDANLQIS